MDKHGKPLAPGDPVVIHNWKGSGWLSLVGMVARIEGDAVTLAYPTIRHADPTTGAAEWRGGATFPADRLLKILPGYQGPALKKQTPFNPQWLWMIG